MTYYKKVGRRYVPVCEEVPWDSFPEGSHLVIVEPGQRTTIYNVAPDDAPIRAALDKPLGELARLIVESSKGITQKEPVTPEQKKAYEDLADAFNGGPYWIQYPSAYEIASKFLSRILGSKP